MLNTIILNGRVPQFNEWRVNQISDKGDIALRGVIDVQRNFKKAGEQYAASDIIDIEATGKTAETIRDYFGKGDGIIVQGWLKKTDKYVNKDNVEVPGKLVVKVEQVLFPVEKKSQGKAEGAASAPAPTPAPSAGGFRPPAGGFRPPTSGFRPPTGGFKLPGAK